MKFKHWKEAETRANELKVEIDALNAEIGTAETEARREDITVEKRDELISALQTKADKRNGAQDEYDDAIKQRDALKASEERQFSLISNLGTPKVTERRQNTEEKNVFETRNYELAWAKYVRTGDSTEVRALMNTQSSESGGILVPTALTNKIEDTLRTGGRIINLCDTTNIKGITEYPIVGNKSDPEKHDEVGASKKEKNIELTSVSMEPQFIAEILKTTRKFENDSISAFWDWLMAEFPDAIRRVIDRKIFVGGQADKDGIHGILTNVKPEFVATLPSHELNFNSANMAVALLDDGVEDNVTIAMNRKTFYNNVMGLTGADGHPIYKQIMSSNLNRPAFAMGGYPVVFTNVLTAYDEAAQDEPYMVAGDFRAMKLNFPDGMNVSVTRDAITEMHDNVVRYLSEIYVAGNITRYSGH